MTVADQFLAADAVVAATGAWTDAFVEPAGLTLGVTAQRGQIVHIGLGMTDTSRWPAILPSDTGHYMLAFDDSRVIAGATRETGSGFDYRITPGGLAEVLDEALAVAPGLASGTYLETRIGFRPMGPDIGHCLARYPASTGLPSPQDSEPRGDDGALRRRTGRPGRPGHFPATGSQPVQPGPTRHPHRE